jgi:putative transposase
VLSWVLFRSVITQCNISDKQTRLAGASNRTADRTRKAPLSIDLVQGILDQGEDAIVVDLHLKLTRPRVPMAVPNNANARWSADFVHDELADGRRFRVLNIVDDFSRVCVGQLTELSISGERMVRYLDQLAQSRALPATLVLDNRPEMTSKAMFFWARRHGIKLHFTQPGKPTQNAFIESFNGKFRDGCLNQQWFSDIHDARVIIDAWREHYNEQRSHSSLGYLPPKIFEQLAA